MFTDDLDENWDSTENQDIFIKEYFGKTKVLPKRGQNVSIKADNFRNYVQNSKDSNKYENSEDHCENSATVSSQIRNKHSLNSDIKCNKKKIKKSSTFLQDHCSIIHENLTDTEMKDSLTADFNSQKSKKKRKKSKKENKVEFEQQSSYDESPKHVNSTEDSDSSEIESKCTTDIISNNSKMNKSSLIQSKFYQKLQAAKFRYLNEMLYTNAGKEALSYFQQNTDEFQDYHVGYQSQVSKWPINPLDIIIQEIHQMNKQVVIADLGCGEARIAEAFPKRTVHSFDLIALKGCVTACDIANVPLPNESVDVAVFCLSLMGTNWKDYIKEGRRILKFGAVLKIAEIESRIEEVELFIKNIESYGFTLENKNLSHKMFILLNFKKINRRKKGFKVPDITLKPCLYKKR